MDDDLEARLQNHSQAFDGLLSLIPAQDYYAKDNSDQWQAKKQTKEQKRMARKAKLDPANKKTAKDVMDENERKRKRELEQEDAAGASEEQDIAAESWTAGTAAKRRKMTDGKTEDEKRQAKADKRRQKREKKHEKIEKKREKAEAKKNKQDDEDLDEALQKRRQDDDTIDENDNAVAGEDAEADSDIDVDIDMDKHLDMSGLADNPPITSDQSSTPDTNLDSPIFDIPSVRDSASSSSTSSIVPPSEPDSSSPHKKSKPSAIAPTPTTKSSGPEQSEHKPQPPPQDREAVQARLKARIEALRTARKALGTDNSGPIPKTRQDLLDSRRKKSEARKAAKKAQRVRAKEEEARLNNERLRGSGSPLTSDIFSPLMSPALSKASENNFSFGRVAFGDAEVDKDGEKSVGGGKRGKDAKHALEAAEKKASRLNGLDKEKREDIESKDLWLNAKKRAHGERVRDDASLLKKTLKRKEGAKLKSGREWNERKEGVQKGIEGRQKKREENLTARKDGKGVKGKQSAAKKGGSKKKKGRPGFEGR